MVPRPPTDRPGPHTAIKRELLVRLLDAWLPMALHGTRRATYLDAYATGQSVAAALGVVAEFPDLLARRRLSVVLVAADGDELALTADVAAVRRRRRHAGRGVGTDRAAAARRWPTAPGDAGRRPAARLPRRGRVAATAGRPEPTLADLLTGARTQALVALDATAFAPERPAEAIERYRAALAGVGPGSVACVELVATDDRAEMLLFRTPTPRALEIFKDALWAVDEYAGVRFRDPRDPGPRAARHLAAARTPGPLRRALLGHLAGAGARTVADLRRYALAETVYRAADVVPVLTAMVAAGAVRRDPAKGRLTADAVISLP